MSKPAGDSDELRRQRVLRKIAGSTALVLFPRDERWPSEVEMQSALERILAMVRTVVPCCCAGPDYDADVPCHHHPIKVKR